MRHSPQEKRAIKLACLRLSRRRRYDNGTSTTMRRLIQIRPLSDHAGGLVSGDDMSWYSEATTLGRSDFMMIR
jgi:hypothetical protein